MNDNIQYSVEFIPFFPQEAEEYGLTISETLVYGFIRFYTKRGQRFYFSNDQIAEIVRCKRATVTNAISKLDRLGVFEVVYAQKANGGTIRFINVKSRLLKSSSQPDPLLKYSSPTTKIQESAPEVEEKNLQTNNKKKKNKIEKIFSEGTESQPATEMSPDLVRKLVWRAKREVQRELKAKYGGNIPGWVNMEREIERKRVSLTQEYEAQTAVVEYPTLESIDESVIAEIAAEKRVSLEDVESVFQTMKERVMGQGSGKWKDMAQMLRTFVSNAISYGTIEKILTFQERIEKEYGIKIDPNAKPSELTTYQDEEPAK